MIFVQIIILAPSRDNEFHTRLYSFDDQLLGTKYRTTRLSNSPGKSNNLYGPNFMLVRPDIGHTSCWSDLISVTLHIGQT